MSDDTIKPLRVHAPQPNARLVEALEDLLAQAKTGELQGLTYVGDLAHRSIVRGQFGAFHSDLAAAGAANHLAFLAHQRVFIRGGGG